MEFYWHLSCVIRRLERDYAQKARSVMRHLSRFGWIVVALALSAPAMAADDSAQSFMKERQTELTGLVRKAPSSENTKKIEQAFDAILDYDALAQGSLEGQW